MHEITRKEALKGFLLLVLLILYNVIRGFDFFSLVFSLSVIVTVLVADIWIILPLRKKTNHLSRVIHDLTVGQKDLTKRANIPGNDEIALVGRKLDVFIGNLHNTIGQSLATANQVSSTMADLTKSSAMIAAGSSDQNRQVGEVASAMEELDTSINVVAKNTGAVAEEARKAAETAKEGQKNVLPAIEGLNRITDTIENSADTLKELAGKGASISQIVTLIEDVADQINLLALNAAIEAARAGEMGRGFAVVADEVKKLAERASKATKDISLLIKSLQETTQGAVGTMQRIVSTARETKESAGRISLILDEIVSTSRGVSDSMQEVVTAAVAQQSATTTEIANNMEKISSQIGEMAKNTKKVSEATLDASRLSDELLREVSGFKMNMFGVVPLENAVIMNKKFKPLVKYLGDQLGLEFIIKVGKDYTEAIEDLGTGRALISYQTPTTYIEGRHKFGMTLLGYFLKDGSPTYRSAIIVAKNSGIKSLAELKGKRFAFGSEKSTGSTLVPTGMLAESGITLPDLRQYSYLGSHDNVANAVLRGEYDAGGMMESVVAEFADKGIVTIKISDPIPQFPVCLTRDIDPETAARIKEALLNLSDNSILKSIDKGYQKFVEARDSDFDVIRSMVKKIYKVDYQ